MAAHVVHDQGFFTRRAIVFFAILCFHVVLIYAFATGLARRAIEVIAPPIQTDIVEEVKKQDAPPPPPPPPMEHPPVEVPPPDVAINIPVESNSTAITDVTNKHVVAAPPPPPPKAVSRVAGGPGKGFPATEDFYPDASKRLGEEGTSVVHVCLGADGKLDGNPSTVRGSGKDRLDQAALKLAKAGQGHYRPATEDGKPVHSCFDFGVKFVLR